MSYKIYRKKNKIIIEIDAWQDSYDAIGKLIGKVPNIVGVIVEKTDNHANFEQGIYQLNELGYKDTIQLGSPMIKTYLEDDEFRKICKELNIDVWEYPICNKCKKPLWGTHTTDKNGKEICFECENQS